MFKTQLRFLKQIAQSFSFVSPNWCVIRYDYGHDQEVRLYYKLMSLNAVTLVGRVGSDPDIKYFESGSVVCNIPLAVDRRTRNNDQPDWFNLELWGKTAEIAANYVRKGSLIGVTGSLKFEYWQDRSTGTSRSKPVIRVDRLQLLGSKRDGDASLVNDSDEGEF